MRTFKLLSRKSDNYLMAQILVVEDSLEVQRIIKDCLKKFEVHFAGDLKTAQTKLDQNSYSLVLLDVGLPDGDGFRFFTHLQSQEKVFETPVVFMTVRSDTEDVVMGFNLGADDYITKPFNPFQFRARIESRMAKIAGKKQDTNILSVGNLKLNVDRQQASVVKDLTENPIDLTPLEFKILHFFSKNEEKVFTRDQIIDEIWGHAVSISDRSVDTHISNIRKKIRDSKCTLAAIYGTGYAFRRSEAA